MFQDAGHLTLHMATHVAAMSLAAPPIAWLGRDRLRRPVGLALATTLQVGLVWFFHIPAVMTAMAHSAAFAVILHVALLGAAVLFWMNVFSSSRVLPWRPVAALLITGKLVCLLGVLLVFADRPIYGTPHEDMAAHHSAAMMRDQQLAGMLMLVACPLTYILAATLVTSRWLMSADTRTRAEVS